MITKFGYTYLEDHERRIADKEFEGLTLRTKNCLLSEALFTKQQVQDLFHIDYTMSELRKIPNLGRKSHKEIAAWLGAYEDLFANRSTILDISIRDYFAAKAMQALLTTSNTTKVNGEYVQNSDEYAEVAYIMADNMMEARKNVS
jgi:hypothetical protein